MAPQPIVVASLVAASILLAGCTFSQPLSEEEAAVRTESAVESLQASLSGGPAQAEGIMADLRKISGTMTMESSAEGMGTSGSGTFSVEWGQDDVWALQADMGQGGFQMTVAVYCTPDRQVVVLGEAYEQRPNDECLGAGGPMGDGFEDDLEGGLEGLAGLEGVELESVTVDGQEVNALLTGPSGESITVHLDAAGRLTHLESDTPDGRVTMDLDYGPLQQITVPEADQRIPTSAYWSGSQDVHTYSGTVHVGETGGEAPLHDIEVRVVSDSTLLASLTASDGSGQDNGWSITFEDLDGDGLLSDGDTFSVARQTTDDDDESTSTYSEWDAVLWDNWADAEAGSNPIPGVAPILVWSLLAGLSYWRRR